MCVCVWGGDGETEAGRGKEPGVSSEDMGWHQIILGRGALVQMTLDSIFNTNKLEREEWKAER